MNLIELLRVQTGPFLHKSGRKIFVPLILSLYTVSILSLGLDKLKFRVGER